MPATGLTVSQVTQSYLQPRIARGTDAFWGSFLAVFCVSEAAGPIFGWPTITGRIYGAVGFEATHPKVWQMLLVLLLQLSVEGMSGYRLWRSNWPVWISSRARRIATITIPDPNRRETSLGLLGGLVVTVLLSVMIGKAPSPRTALMVAEAIVIVVSLTAITLALIFPPTIHYSIAHPDNVIFERMRLAPSPVQVTFNRTEFQKSILLRRQANHYEPHSFDGPIRLHEFEHVLINYGVYEKRISVPVKVKSANVFECDGMFSLDVHPPAPDEMLKLDGRGVEILINSLYSQHDLHHFLTERLTAAMHAYAGKYDSELKTMVETFGLRSLRSELETSGRFAEPPAGMAGALSLSAVHVTQLEVQKARIKDRLVRLEEYQTKWQEARVLQQAAQERLPQVFDQQLLQFFTNKLTDSDPKAMAAISRLLLWSKVRFFANQFRFAALATQAETLLETETNKVRAELQAVEQEIAASTKASAVQLRDIIKNKIDQIDPRWLMSSTGQELFHALSQLLMLDDRSLIARAPAVLARSYEAPSSSSAAVGAPSPGSWPRNEHAGSQHPSGAPPGDDGTHDSRNQEPF